MLQKHTEHLRICSYWRTIVSWNFHYNRHISAHNRLRRTAMFTTSFQATRCMRHMVILWIFAHFTKTLYTCGLLKQTSPPRWKSIFLPRFMKSKDFRHNDVGGNRVQRSVAKRLRFCFCWWRASPIIARSRAAAASTIKKAGKLLQKCTPTTKSRSRPKWLKHIFDVYI